VDAGEYFGKVIIRGDATEQEEDAIRRRLEHIAQRARWTEPLRRIVSVERRGGDLEVLTTSQKLAHRIVRSLVGAFGGAASYGWSESDGELRAMWRWECGVPRRARPRRSQGAKTPGTIRLEIQSRHADVDPLLRNLIERSAERWAERYPRLLSLHVTLQHGRHRHGVERVTMVAGYPAHMLRVEKQGESMEDAVHSACIALGRELRKAKEVQANHGAVGKGGRLRRAR
jgi:ribosome-associated translation inhibitor RaiA